MKRFVRILVFAMSLLTVIPLGAQNANADRNVNKDEQMIHAQLRFIVERAHLTRREYRNFAPIYIEYTKSLLELNQAQEEKRSQTEPSGMGMPFDFRPDIEQMQEYGRRWGEIDETYRKKLSKALPDSTCVKIGIAQWELNEKIWKEWEEKGREMMERRFGHMGMGEDANMDTAQMRRFEEMRKNGEQRWRELNSQHERWGQNYWNQWHFPGQPGQWPGQPGQWPGMQNRQGTQESDTQQSYPWRGRPSRQDIQQDSVKQQLPQWPGGPQWPYRNWQQGQ